MAADDFDVRTVRAVIEACSRGAPPEREHSFLEFIRDGLNRRLDELALQIAKERRGKTPPPRRPSSPILPPEPAWSRVATDQTVQFSRAETEQHNPRKLLEEAREADFEHRPTPVDPGPVEPVTRAKGDPR